MNTTNKQCKKTYDNLIEHFKCYPKHGPEDVFKYIFQSSFGCEHMLSQEGTILKYIKQEYETLSKTEPSCVEQLDGEYSRVHLSCLNDGLTPETLSKLFCLSAKKEPDGMVQLERKLEVAGEAVDDGLLSFDSEIFHKKLDEWKGAGYPAVHHSDVFRSEYKPSYRVISDKYAKFLSVFRQIDVLLQNGRAIVAIEGGSASGKTTLSEILKQVYDCNVFHMDDFFLPSEKRTQERLSQAGGNVDRERFFDEVLKPLSENREVLYKRFDCSTQTLNEPVRVAHKKLSIIEGAYSMHPILAPYYDFSVFLDIDRQFQKKRILQRNTPKFAKRFFDEWIPFEQNYFLQMNIKDSCSLCLKVEES